MDYAVTDIAIYAAETTLLKLLLQHAHHGSVELTVEQEYIVSLRLGSFDVAVLLVFVGGVEVYKVAFLVGLCVLDKVAVFVVCEVFAVNVFEQSKGLGLVVEIVFRQHAVVYEQLQVVPLLLKVFAVGFEYRLQSVADFLGNVRRDFLYIRVALQVAAANV